MSELEQKLAQTGDPNENAEFVQWLPQVNGSSWPLHVRPLAANLHPGINLVDHPVEEWDDPRVSYISLLDDTLVISTQYTGSFSTLVRLATTVVSDKLWRRCLTEDKLWGDGGVGLSSEVTRNLVQKASQIGYLSQDDSYESFRERIKGVRNGLRKDLAAISRTDGASREEALREAHGLLASATQLYQQLDIDIVVEIRVPDRNRTRDEDFLNFFAQTVPKQATYEGHSFFRRVYESDPDKRAWTAPLADEGYRQATPTVSWVVAGDRVTGYEEPIRQRLQEFDETHRQDEREDYVSLELPLVVADSWSTTGIRQTVELVLGRKGMCPPTGSVGMQNTIGLFHGLTGSVYDVVDALTTLDQSKSDTVGYQDVVAGLATLPSDRLLPDQQPTMGALLKVLLRADEPLSGTELIDHEEFTRSARSYYNHKSKLAAFELAEETADGWELRLDRYWDDSLDDLRPMRASRILWRALIALDEDPPVEPFGRPIQFDEMADGDTIEPWVETIRSLSWKPPEDTEPEVVVLGADSPQSKLEEWR